MKKNMLKLLIGSIILAALIGIIGILIGDFNEEMSKALSTAFIIIGFSIVGIIYAQIEDNIKLKYLMPTGMAITIVYFAILIMDIWKLIPIDEKFIGTVTYITIAALWINIVASIKEREKYIKYIKIPTTFVIVILSVMASYSLWNHDLSDFYFRLMAVIGILSITGTSISALISKLTK